MNNVVYMYKDGIFKYVVFHDPKSKSVITFTDNHINYQNYKCDCYCSFITSNSKINWHQYIEK